MLVCDWAQKIILCPVRGQHLSRCFRDLFIRRGLPANSTVWPFSSRRVFGENGAAKKERNSIIGKISVKLVHLLCMQQYTISQEIVDMNRADACIINVYGYTEILPRNLACQQKKTKRKMHRLNKSDFGLFKDKFVNARVLLSLFMRNRLRCLLRPLNIIVRHVQENFFAL